MFASDGHTTTSTTLMKLAQMPFPPETRRKILGENALRLLLDQRASGERSAAMTECPGRGEYVVGTVSTTSRPGHTGS